MPLWSKELISNSAIQTFHLFSEHITKHLNLILKTRKILINPKKVEVSPVSSTNSFAASSGILLPNSIFPAGIPT